jgi:hypothetical protein
MRKCDGFQSGMCDDILFFNGFNQILNYLPTYNDLG